MRVSGGEIDRAAEALGGAPASAYTTPIVYPWSVQHYVPQPGAPRPALAAGAHRLYVHVPFCNYHCTFCFYAVRTGAKRAEMERYVAALERELAWVPAETELSRLTIGGGTPTAMPPDLLDRTLAAVFERLRPAAGAVHTVETSPDSITDAHIQVLLSRGIGRVSMGVESMDPAVLTTVQRRHSPEQALAACRRIATSGLTLNVDFIYGLPGQTEDSVRRDLDAISAAGVTTLCLYGLRLNSRTVVASQLTAAERLDLARTMRWRAFVKAAAASAGFVQTRPYTFRRAEAGARWHEQVYVRAGSGYEAGIGMSARSQLGRVAYRNHDRTSTYMERVEQGSSPVESVFELGDEDLKVQLIASVLANGRPLPRSVYEAAFGTSIDADFGALLERLVKGGLIEDDGATVVLTEVGMLVYDRVLLCFYSDRARGWLAEAPAARQGPNLRRHHGGT